MFTRVIAYPTGNVEIYYGDRVVVTGKDGISKIRTTLYDKKESYGLLDLCPSLRHSSSQYSMDELPDDL